MTALLEVRDVRKNYGPHLALSGVSFQVEAGEIFGLLGPNGAGKTTLLSILSGLSEASHGEVYLGGERFHPGSRKLKPLLGIAPQDLALYPELTARENLAFFAQLYGVNGTALKERVDRLLDALGLADRADQQVHTFSGGMKRRLNLGAAVVHGPRLLLLDEPTTGVDPQSRNHLFDEVRRLHAAGTTILYTSHYMEEVQALCPRIGILDHGRLIACDTLPRLLQMLPGKIRFRTANKPEGLTEKLAFQEGRGMWELETENVQASLARLMRALGGEVETLEVEEPNLERVFLHLTGRALRD